MRTRIDQLLSLLRRNADERERLRVSLAEALDGRNIRIEDEYFNGQPYGTSRRRRKGEVFTFSKGDWLVIDDNGDPLLSPPRSRTSIHLSSCTVAARPEPERRQP